MELKSRLHPEPVDLVREISVYISIVSLANLNERIHSNLGSPWDSVDSWSEIDLAKKNSTEANCIKMTKENLISGENTN